MTLPTSSDQWVQWKPVPRNTLLASRVPWVSWVSMALRRKETDLPTPSISGRPGASQGRPSCGASGVH
eukprot:8704566-Pyramimonas_sp.AAC.1